MRKLEIKQAVRKGNKARILLSGPSGSGKTFQALMIARALVGKEGKIVGIDTEHGSMSLYSDKYHFEVIEWQPPFDPRELAQALRELDGKYDAIVPDSLSHFWMGEGGTLAVVDAAAERSKGNKFAGWKEGTPAQNDLVEAIVRCDAHLIATARAKTEYVQEKDEKGRTSIRKLGLAPIQREGIEFEFDIQGEVNAEHDLVITKSRCDLVADKVFKKDKVPQFAKVVGDWLAGAQPIAPEPEAITQKQLGSIIGLARKAGVMNGDDTTSLKSYLSALLGKEITSSKEILASELPKIETDLKSKAAATPVAESQEVTA